MEFERVWMIVGGLVVGIRWWADGCAAVVRVGSPVRCPTTRGLSGCLTAMVLVAVLCLFPVMVDGQVGSAGNGAGRRGDAGTAGPADDGVVQESISASDVDRAIDEAITRLADASPQVRKRATEKLLQLGPAAVAALREATESDDFETVVRAKALLAVFDKLLFMGATMTLKPSPEAVSPGEAFDLVFVVENKSEVACRLPFEERREGVRRRSSAAEQVGDMLDIADYLVVRDPSGRRVDMVVDDIRKDEAVRRAVEVRASDDPPTSVLAAGKTLRRTIRNLNTGWARYPMANKGRYSIQFVYQPQWNDDGLNADRVGRVESKVCYVTVRDSR